MLSQKFYLLFIHRNIRSLSRSRSLSEKEEAVILSLESPPDILCLAETWLTKKSKLGN